MTNSGILTRIMDSKDIQPMDKDSSFLMTYSEFLKRITLIIPSLDGKIFLTVHSNFKTFFNRYEIPHYLNHNNYTIHNISVVIKQVKWKYLLFLLAATHRSISSEINKIVRLSNLYLFYLTISI